MFGQSSLDQGATKQKGKAKQQRSNALLAFLLFGFGCFFCLKMVVAFLLVLLFSPKSKNAKKQLNIESQKAKRQKSN